MPCDNRDIIEVDPSSSHVVVLKRNRIFYFKALWPDGTVAVSVEDIVDILKAIEKDVVTVKTEDLARSALGVLTTLERRAWYCARHQLETSSVHNREALDIVDSALFVLALDEFVPQDMHQAAANMLHGTYKWEKNEDMIDFQVREWSEIVNMKEKEEHGFCC